MNESTAVAQVGAPAEQGGASGPSRGSPSQQAIKQVAIGHRVSQRGRWPQPNNSEDAITGREQRHAVTEVVSSPVGYSARGLGRLVRGSRCASGLVSPLPRQQEVATQMHADQPGCTQMARLHARRVGRAPMPVQSASASSLLMPAPKKLTLARFALPLARGHDRRRRSCLARCTYLGVGRSRQADNGSWTRSKASKQVFQHGGSAESHGGPRRRPVWRFARGSIGRHAKR
jgi:hypothetical protein